MIAAIDECPISQTNVKSLRQKRTGQEMGSKQEKEIKTDKYQREINFQHINLMDLFKLNCILLSERNERVRWMIK